MQTMVQNFMRGCPQPMSIETCMLDIASELGELAKEVNIATSWSRYDDYKFRKNAKTELGQVAFTVLQLATLLDIDVESALEEVITEFRERYRKQGHTGSAEYIVP